MRNSIIALALVLAACAGSPETKATNALGVACDTYSTVLTQLVPHKPDMSADTVGRIDSANQIADKACLPGSDIDPAKAVETVRAAINTLKSIKESFQ
jgi:hypothetical protein